MRLFISQFWLYNSQLLVYITQFWLYNSQLLVYITQFWLYNSQLLVYITQFWLYNSQLLVYIMQFWLYNSQLLVYIMQFCEKSQNCEIKSHNNLFFIFFIQWRKRASIQFPLVTLIGQKLDTSALVKIRGVNFNALTHVINLKTLTR